MKPEFEEDSLLCAKYSNWPEMVKASLPDSSTLVKLMKPAKHVFDSMIIDTNHRLLICTPEELSSKKPINSYFRYKLGGNEDKEQDFFFTYINHNFPGERDIYTQADRIKEFIANKFFCVFFEDEKKTVYPQVDSSARTFIPGKISGWVVIFNFNTTKPVAIFKVSAVNSPDVNYKTFYDDATAHEYGIGLVSPIIQTRVDLWYNIGNDVKKKLVESGAKMK
jgi:hypothetical protein